MRRSLPLAIALFALAFSALSLSSERRSCRNAAEDEGSGNAEIAALLEPIREKHQLPALAGAIVNKEGVVVAGAVGKRVEKVGPAVTVEDKFHLGSCTKAMTATLLATFVEEGKLHWETTLAEALPELADGMRPEYREVTITQLLAHRAGFPAKTAAPGLSLIAMRKLQPPLEQARLDYVQRILDEPPESPPGTKFVYANRGYIVAGVIAERLGGAPWEELMTDRIFRPLKMTSAGFGGQATIGCDDPAMADQPWPHRLVGKIMTPVSPGPSADNPPLMGPAGTVHASMTDWGKFIACHLRAGKGEPALLKPETFAVLHKRPEQGDYAYGWIFADRDWAGGTAWTHSGSNTINRAIVWIAPERGVAFLAVTNFGDQGSFEACDKAIGALIHWQAERH